MAYNHGKAERRWRLWKEKEEKILRECGVDEETIEEIRTFDREEFNSDRRFYTRLNDVGEYIAETAMQELPMEVNTVWDMLNEIEDENLYRALLTVDKRTLQIVLLKMQGYSLKEIAPMVDLSAGAVYARLDHLRKKTEKTLIVSKTLLFPAGYWVRGQTLSPIF